MMILLKRVDRYYSRFFEQLLTSLRMWYFVAYIWLRPCVGLLTGVVERKNSYLSVNTVRPSDKYSIHSMLVYGSTRFFKHHLRLSASQQYQLIYS